MSCFLCHLVLGAAHGGLLFVVCGFWGLFCFGLPGSLDFCVWGVGLGLVWFSGLFTDCCSGLASCFVVWGLVGVLLVLFGEFDPGSGRTLAACLTHASRTVKGLVLLVLDEWRTGE